MMLKTNLLSVFLFAGVLLTATGIPNHALADFSSEDATSEAIGLMGAKDGGVIWVDLDSDGDADLIINTVNSGTHLFVNQGAPNFNFVDVTAVWAPGLAGRDRERSVIAGDLNHDGFPDFIVNTNPTIDIWINNGPSGAGDFSFGNGGGTAPSQVLNNAFTLAKVFSIPRALLSSTMTTMASSI